MSSVVRPSTVEDQPQLIEFLIRVFLVGREHPIVNPELMRWKFWQPRADWTEPRSLVIEKNGRITAHVGLWPVTLSNGSQMERGTHMIDWASDPESPGGGVSLLQRVVKSYDFVYSIGGSDMTQTILPRFGFRTIAQALTFARPIRPFRQMLQHQTRDVRLPLRFARNVWWSKVPRKIAMDRWSYTQANAAT
ncbi:MAG: GNAT family N-acetyltransferase, partial [Acidobacteriaceae bacterium]|nr:GNAT family N-acetyltransferase [Acidobacteriaceae bacterium]